MSLRGIANGDAVAISRKGYFVINPRGILCTRGEKAHTSKRVSIIACDNAISKVQFIPHSALHFTFRQGL